MNSTVARASVVFLTTAFIAAAADNSIGKWKLNAAKSQILATTPMKTSTVVIDKTPAGMRFADHREHHDGTIRDSEYTVKYDGKDYPAKGTSYDMVAVRQLDANTFTIERSNARASTIRQAD